MNTGEVHLHVCVLEFPIQDAVIYNLHIIIHSLYQFFKYFFLCMTTKITFQFLISILKPTNSVLLYIRFWVYMIIG